MTLAIDRRDSVPILYRGAVFALLCDIVDNDQTPTITDVDASLYDQSGSTLLLGPLRMADTGRSDYSEGLVDIIIPGASSISIAYQGDASLVVQIVGGARYVQTVRVV